MRTSSEINIKAKFLYIDFGRIVQWQLLIVFVYDFCMIMANEWYLKIFSTCCKSLVEAVFCEKGEKFSTVIQK